MDQHPNCNGAHAKAMAADWGRVMLFDDEEELCLETVERLKRLLASPEHEHAFDSVEAFDRLLRSDALLQLAEGYHLNRAHVRTVLQCEDVMRRVLSIVEAGGEEAKIGRRALARRFRALMIQPQMGLFGVRMKDLAFTPDVAQALTRLYYSVKAFRCGGEPRKMMAQTDGDHVDARIVEAAVELFKRVMRFTWLLVAAKATLAELLADGVPMWTAFWVQHVDGRGHEQRLKDIIVKTVRAL
jgi:hypothetical protein